MNHKPDTPEERPQHKYSMWTWFGSLWKRVWNSMHSHRSNTGEQRPQHKSSTWTMIGLLWWRLWGESKRMSSTHEELLQHQPSTLPHGILIDGEESPSITKHPQFAEHEQGGEEDLRPEDRPQENTLHSCSSPEQEKEEYSGQEGKSQDEPSFLGSAQDHGDEVPPGPGGEPQDGAVSSNTTVHTGGNEQMVITNIRATDVALGLRRLPAGFYAMVHHSGLEWKTENKSISVSDDVVEWCYPIPIPTDLSATVRIEVYASFEFQPVLGVGEQLRQWTITVKQLLDRSAKHVSLACSSEDREVVSPCSSILVTVEQRSCQSSASSPSKVLSLHDFPHKSQAELEHATDQGHSALSRYRKYEQKLDLEYSIERFERALDICPPDHPCHAVAEANLAMAKFILCQVERVGVSLKVPLRLYSNVLAVRPVGHLDRPFTLIQLAAVHFARFGEGEDEMGRVQAKALLHEAIELSPTDSHESRVAAFMLQLLAGQEVNVAQSDGGLATGQDLATYLTDEDTWIPAIQLLHLFERFGDLANLQQAIILLEQLVKFTPVWDDRRRQGLMVLGVALSRRFDRLGELNDLESAISRHRESLDLTPHGHPDKSGCLNNLGNSFKVRFKRLGDLSDLGNAISTLTQAVDLTPHADRHRPAHLSNLGTCFNARFERVGELSDLETALSRHMDAVDITPYSHPSRPAHLSNLGTSFAVRFTRLGELSDLENAIPILRDAIELTPRGHPDKPRYLMNLGNSLQVRFKRLGESSDLEDAISALRDAVNLTPHGHPDKPARLNNLGVSFSFRSERFGDLKNVEDAISTLRNAVDITPQGHPLKPACLNNLGDSFFTRFKRLGELSDLEEAISAFKKAVDLTPHGHPARARRLSNLGTSIKTRYKRLGEITDLENAISRQRDAIDLIPHGHFDKPSYLNNLGISLVDRFNARKEWRDLKEATLKHRDAVDMTPYDHPDKATRLMNLATSFEACFQHFGELSYLDNAISWRISALGLAPQDHPHRAVYLSCLGGSFATRFEHLGELGDLEEAISRHKDAIALTPRNHPDKPAHLSKLGITLKARFERLGELPDLEDAISLFSHAACSPIGPIVDRFHSSLEWISCARILHHNTLLQAYSISIALLPQLAWIGHSLKDRYSQLQRGADVVREAAAAALESGLPETALEWLEQGRSIVWGELLQLHSSYDDLSSTHPDHARRLQELSAALDSSSATREKSTFAFLEHIQKEIWGLQHDGVTNELLVEEAMNRVDELVHRHRTLAIERDKLLVEIRRIPGFEQFLLWKSFSHLRASAHAGPVVVLNAAESRCDALIVLAEVGHVIHVPLPNFTLKRSTDLQKILSCFIRRARDDREGTIEPLEGISWESFLAPLWKCVVKPVLDALAFSSPGDHSRIFWCPTGPFVFLPIHAAGFYDAQLSGPGHKVYDFVVSSYVPTLSVLAPSPTRSLTTSPDHSLRLLAVRQPPSDGLPRLPGVHTELEYIKDIVKNAPSECVTLLESSTGTVEEILSMMKDSDWVHFACHGIQDVKMPIASGLCLAHRRRLKLLDIIALSRPRGGLAFLSACQTATGDEGLCDEALHIAAGMLYSGYAGVVGTMWSISDRLAPQVAKGVYEWLFQNDTRPDYRDAARALHDAIGHLRDDDDVPFEEWIPFIHVGL